MKSPGVGDPRHALTHREQGINSSSLDRIIPHALRQMARKGFRWKRRAPSRAIPRFFELHSFPTFEPNVSPRRKKPLFFPQFLIMLTE
jgi:hypothetical protein